jgi:Rad3-related DNA helicase
MQSGIEDRFCPYYLQLKRLKHADLILMPYTYLINENIIKTMRLKLKDAILIIDEGHNIG